MTLRSQWLGLISAVGLSAVGLNVPELWFLACAGLAAYLFLLRAASPPMLKAVWFGLVFGVGSAGAATIWFWQALPLDFLMIRNRGVQTLAVGMTWIYVSTSLGLAVALVAPLTSKLSARRGGCILTALLWCLTERARMWGFALATWAPGTLLGSHFSIASFGYPLTECAMLRGLAFPYGIDALNFITAFTAAFLAELGITIVRAESSSSFFRSRVSEVALVCLVCIAHGAASSSEARHDLSGPLRIAILANHHEDVRDLSGHSFLRAQLQEVAAAIPPVDVVVFPEEFSLTSIFWSQREAKDFISAHFKERDVLLLHTRNDSFPAEETNNSPEEKKLIYESTRFGEQARYIKLNLMPLGEYAPAFTRTFFSVLHDPELKLYLASVHELIVPQGETALPVVERRGVRLGALLCSDLLSPTLYRRLAQVGRADILLNLANQFWFHSSRLLYRKTVQAARVHAAQSRVPFVLVNNLAPSFVLAPSGEFLAESNWGSSGPLYVSLPLGAIGARARLGD